MTLESIPTLLAQVSNYPYLLILLTILLTYAYVVIRGGFVSDDLQGIQGYDGTLMYPDDTQDAGGKSGLQPGESPKKVLKICYGTISKWVRYHICGGHFPSKHRYPGPEGKPGDPIPSGKVPSHHHILSIVLHFIACVLLYQFLISITTPTVALLTVLLFTVHPTCVQAVAWPSAIGYILSLICICSVLNIAAWTMLGTDLTRILIGLAGITFFQVWGVYAQGIPLTTGLILLLLGHWHLGIFALLIGGAASAINLGGYVRFRKSEFKKQNMDHSTSLNILLPCLSEVDYFTG